MFAWKDENKRKRGRDGPFKNLDSLICSARKSSIKYQSSPQPNRAVKKEPGFKWEA